MQAAPFCRYRVAGAFARHPGWRAGVWAGLLALACFRLEIPLHFFTPWLLAECIRSISGRIISWMRHEVAQAPNDPVIQARLDACVFKGAVRNRATGEWEAVPMCSMNESRWSALYAERMEAVEGLKGDSPPNESSARVAGALLRLRQVGPIQIEIFCSITLDFSGASFLAARENRWLCR